MAATPFDHGPSSNAFFDIYADGQVAARNSNSPVLPGGQCNFVDLTPGAHGARCGCRRFWSRLPTGRGYQDAAGPDQVVWCMCSHHACFHDDVRTGQTPTPSVPAGDVVGQENERPRTNREPLSPMQVPDLSLQIPSHLGSSFEFPSFNFTTSGAVDKAAPHLTLSAATQGAKGGPGPAASLPDTLGWEAFIQSQPGAATANGCSTLPPIPSQCLMSSQPPSTASSSQARYLRPFGGKGLQTLSSVSPSNTKDPLTEVARNDDGAEDGKIIGRLQNALDNEQISITGSNIPSTLGPDAPLSEASSQRPSIAPSNVLGHGGYRHLQETVQGHEHRLNQLENVSFSAAGHDDCHDRHEHADLRVTDLEGRVDEVERILNDSNSTGTARRLVRLDAGDDATNSVVSVSTSRSSKGFDHAELWSQFQLLQAKVNQMAAATMPTFNEPWEVEVVMLPFPLHGIWMEQREFPSQRQSGANEWTQAPNTISAASPVLHSPTTAEWAGQDTDSAWLLPRACAPNKVIDNRLRSRGFVKTVSIKGPDARSVNQAITTAFGYLLRPLPFRTGSAHSYSHDARVDKFLGLTQSWVPLRKIHKDSRLRFLGPAEMLTPSLWDVAFLISSVVMKSSGMQRLYVAQPEAYLQDRHAYAAGWDWQRIRELNRVYPDSQASEEVSVPEADALESYWSFNERLDNPPSQREQASQHVAARRSVSRMSTSPSPQFFTGAESPMLSSVSPVLTKGKSPAVTAMPSLKDRKGSRPPHVRTTSMPPSLPQAPSPAQSKRRITSYTTERKSSPYAPLASASGSRPSPRLISRQQQAQLRRSTRSPSLSVSARLVAYGGYRNTPRYSTKSPSPMPGIERGQRRSTPGGCYATPYSNGPPDPGPVAVQGTRDSGPGSIRIWDDGDGIGDECSSDEDMADQDYNGDDRGSDTDPHDDTEMTNDADDHLDQQADPEADEVDSDDDVVKIYDDSSLEEQHPGQGHVAPEDDPWPGIEDRSDGENVDPLSSGNYAEAEDIDETLSDSSSQPSEYPSKQPGAESLAFPIHEDGGESGMFAGIGRVDTQFG